MNRITRITLPVVLALSIVSVASAFNSEDLRRLQFKVNALGDPEAVKAFLYLKDRHILDADAGEAGPAGASEASGHVEQATIALDSLQALLEGPLADADPGEQMDLGRYAYKRLDVATEQIRKAKERLVAISDSQDAQAVALRKQVDDVIARFKLLKKRLAASGLPGGGGA